MDLSTFKLGKLPARHLTGLPKLSSYTSGLAPAPDTMDWTKGVTSWGMMANNRLGDCTAAGCGHALQVWTLNESSEVTVTDDDVISFYSATTGYDPSDPSTDQGGIETDVLSYWHDNGLCGYPLEGFVSVQPKSQADVQDAIWLFGGAYLGVELPISAQTQTVWDVPAGGPQGDGAPGSWGGHCVYAVSYDSRNVQVITWGMLKSMTWAFFTTYVSETYALLSSTWASSDTSPSGFSFDVLKTDLEAFRKSGRMMV